MSVYRARWIAPATLRPVFRDFHSKREAEAFTALPRDHIVFRWREVGKAEKPSDVRVAPLCPAHHLDGPDAQHRTNEREWWATLGVFPPTFCAALVAAFDAGEPGMAVVRLAARGGFPWP